MPLLDQLQITHHGAIDGVTGSCHSLTLPGGDAVLVDCGLFQGAETSDDGAGPGKLEISFDISTVRALLVTRLHIDHVGRIPKPPNQVRMVHGDDLAKAMLAQKIRDFKKNVEVVLP
jgi:Cft2 family RNA processing exonuclease